MIYGPIDSGYVRHEPRPFPGEDPLVSDPWAVDVGEHACPTAVGVLSIVLGAVGLAIVGAVELVRWATRR